MYHRKLQTLKALALGAGVLTLAMAAPASAQSDPVKCQQAISAAAQKYEVARSAAIAKCRTAQRAGKINGLLVCGQAPPTGDQSTFDAIQKADAKRAAAIAKACGGADKQFGGGDDIALSAIGWTGRVPACDLGERDGLRCQTNADCPARCVGGIRDGQGVNCPVNNALNSSCPSGCTGICAGGSKNGQTCFTNSDCPGGTCGSKTCKGGTNNGNTCSTSADCPGNNPCQQSNGCGFGGKTVDECPDIEKEGCNNALTTLADVDTCVKCIGDTGSKQVVDHFFNELTPRSATLKTLEKCKATITKEGTKYFAAHRKELAKCQKNALKNNSPNICPDAAATGKITAARQKLLDSIAKACGGKDKAFGGTGVNADLTPDAIGAPVSCPNLDPPGPAPSCYGFIATAQDLANCAACLVDYKASVLDAAVVTADDPTPPELNPLCGNAKIDAGETCDDGNTREGDACPGTCAIAACPFSPATATVTVGFDVPPGTNVTGIVIYLDYPESKVEIPGQADSLAVQNSISVIPSNNATFTPNDLNYAIRVVLVDNDAVPFPPGAPGLIDITMRRCASQPLPTPGEFRCRVQSASDGTNASATVYTATCSVLSVS